MLSCTALNIQIFDFLCGEGLSGVNPSSHRLLYNYLKKKFSLAGALQAEIAGGKSMEPAISN